MDYNITYRKKDKGIQAIVSYKTRLGEWKQKSKQGFKTKGDAKTWAQDTIDDLKENADFEFNDELSELTFDELLSVYIKHAELYKESNTLKSYSSAYTHFKSIESMNVKDIDSLQLQECIDDMVRMKLASDTVSSYTAKIRVVLNYAVSPLKIIKWNPLSDAVLPTKVSQKKADVKALNKFERDDLLRKITYKKHYLLSLIAVTCGLRLGEILGLTWDNIDEKNSTITINKQWKIIKNSPLTHGFGKLKSKNSDRTIPIPPNTLKELKQYKKNNPIDFSNRVFPYARTDSISTGLRSLYERLGYDISIHVLRHTYASALIASGLDFKTVAELMGHTVKETIETYSHFTSDMMERATNVVNSIF